MNWRRHIKRTTKQYILVAAICIVVIGTAALFTTIVIARQIEAEFAIQLKTVKMELDKNKRNIFVATENISPGNPITMENTKKKVMLSSQPEVYDIKEEDLGKVALVDIPAETQITASMVTENTMKSEIREVEFEVIHLNNNMINGDAVDVRICYPNGESYVILSKKTIKGYDPGLLACYLWLDEEELLRMSAAIVDAGSYPGSKLYVTRYIEPNIQEESVVTYTPNISILSLIESDPNIVERCSQELRKEVRKAMENRLSDYMDYDASKVRWDLETQYRFAGELPVDKLVKNDGSENIKNEESKYESDESEHKEESKYESDESEHDSHENEKIKNDESMIEYGNREDIGYLYYAENAVDGGSEYGD